MIIYPILGWCAGGYTRWKSHPRLIKRTLSFLRLVGYYQKKRALMLGKIIKIIATVINPDVIGLSKIKLIPSYNCIDLEKLSSSILPKIKPINKGGNG